MVVNVIFYNRHVGDYLGENRGDRNSNFVSNPALNNIVMIIAHILLSPSRFLLFMLISFPEGNWISHF